MKPRTCTHCAGDPCRAHDQTDAPVRRVSATDLAEALDRQAARQRSIAFVETAIKALIVASKLAGEDEPAVAAAGVACERALLLLQHRAELSAEGIALLREVAA
jgi:hypothetical protein